MGPLIERKFKQTGDVELVGLHPLSVLCFIADKHRVQARDLVRHSSGVERTRDLAKTYADKAKEALSLLPDSEAKSALEVLTERVVKRTH